MKNNSLMKGHIAAIFTIFIWGTTFISTKVLLTQMTPVEILFIRFAIGFIALILIYPKRLILKDVKQNLYFAGAGLCGVTLYFLLENFALTYSLASNIGVIISIAPFFTALLAHFFLKSEHLKANFFIGFIAAIIGILLISYNASTNLELNPIGDILAVLAAFVWAIYSILTKKISNFKYPVIQTTRRIFFYGLLFMIPALCLFDFQLNPKLFSDTILLSNILYLGFGASAMCFVIWNYAIHTLGAIKSSAYIYLVPVVTIVFSFLILQEKITPLALVGTILTLLGLLISEWKTK